MSSVIEGYNYDIFISYRQKDNKYDGWVTEFVNNLQKELDATFKEEISVYFDSNPHDGLLEIHDVEESLREKLRCLLFIPIFSRTYCDLQSYAWEHEFREFVEIASNDDLGLKIKLPGGNVASRILPILIHSPEPDDKRNFQMVSGSVLRGIEFIYSELGVDRPLMVKDDEARNFNKTLYRNQINKTANSIKEIISGLKNTRGRDWDSVSLDTMERISFTRKEKSIIVLPFTNLSPDPDQDYFSDGLTEEIITDLSYIRDLLVISRSSAMTFKGSKKTIPEIAREVNVHYVMEGSVRKSGNNLKIVAQLIDAESDAHLWAEKFIGTLDDIFEIQEKVSQSISTALKLKITSTEKSKLAEIPISDIVSYELFLKAKKYMWTFSEAGLDEAMIFINEALKNSGENALLYASRAIIMWQYHNAGFRPTEDTLTIADIDADKALVIDSGCNAGYSAKGYICYTKGDLKGCIDNFRKVFDSEALGMSGYAYALAGMMNYALENLIQALQRDPLNHMNLLSYSFYELFRGSMNSAATYLLKAYELSPGDPLCQYYYALTRIYSGEPEKALEAYRLLMNKDNGIFGELSAMWNSVIVKNETGFKEAKVSLKDYALRDKELSWWLADCSALMGETEEVLFWVNNSIEQGFFNYTFFSQIDPLLAGCRNDPRFNDLMLKAMQKQELLKKNLCLI
jgi:TolB-like protein